MISPHGSMPVSRTGPALKDAKAALILIHGRGADPSDILSLVPFLGAESLHVMAPAAAQHTWYPNSFLASIPSNEPGIQSGIAKINELVEEALAAGIPERRIVIGGFSQGACLGSEFVARHPRSYGGLLAFSGGLIGPKDTPRTYPGSLEGLRVFLGCSDVDFHIPSWRVEETASVLSRMGAEVDMRLYPGMGHTINGEELKAGKDIIEGLF